MPGKDKQDETPEAEAAAQGKGGSMLTTILLALVAAAGTFGMVWMASGEQTPSAPQECTVVAREPLSAEEIAARTASYVELDAMTVSLAPSAGADHVRMTLVLGLPEGQEPFTDVQFLRLRDRFVERLRLLDATLITDPAEMPELKSNLLELAKGTLGQDAVLSVLITEFLIK